MPPDHRFRGDDDKGVLPTRPDSSSNYPEELVEQAYAWARMPALQHGELLAQREILEEEAPTRPHEAKQRSKGQGNESKHGQEL